MDKGVTRISQQQAMQKIPGLLYIANYLDSAQQQILVKIIDQQSWITDLKRRTQHYGYRYFFKTGMIYPFSYLGKFPEWLQNVASELYRKKIVTEVAQQALINEYLPGQGIGTHVDTVPCFGEEVVSISLISECFMIFKHKETKEKFAIVLEPGSLVCMKKEARYEWAHGIKKSEVELVSGKQIIRQRRLAITMRTVQWKTFSMVQMFGKNTEKEILESLFTKEQSIWLVVSNLPQKYDLLACQGEWHCVDGEYLFITQNISLVQAIHIKNIINYGNAYFVDPQEGFHFCCKSNSLFEIKAYKSESFSRLLAKLSHFDR
ncbi:alpha-ketoglutarate-dependent dioxygenase AlkB [Candidatus Uabimicrobium sp. HlEnr_7]|uniref:alpha-ketoglutarate-dependent dioxygenase AlkB n=1 Tax=Candidatus Uabimicrobium helgolandensis TaxID=3095367 RepID=UPI00355767EC